MLFFYEGISMKFIDQKTGKDVNAFEKLYAKLLTKEIPDGYVETFSGCIYRIRIMSGFSFVLIRTARRVVQCVYTPEKADFDIEAIKEGYYVNLKCEIKREDRSKIGYDFNILSCKVLVAPEFELPFVLNKKELDLSFDKVLDFRPISMRNQKERAAFKICDGIMQGFRKYFNEADYTEIVTPKIVSAGAEGGADMFALDYFGKKAFLAQSPQVYKQMMVGVFDKVFSMGSVFRAEKSHTSRHITEFQGIDMEIGYIDSFEDVMAEETRAILSVLDHLRKNFADELKILEVTLPEFTSIPSIKFMEIKKIIAEKYKRAFRSEDDFEPEEEKLIGEYFLKEHKSNLVFITHYPSSKRPFYAMDDPENPNYTLSFDLLLNGSEITTGGQRIHEYSKQIEKMKARGMDINLFESYLMIHKYGMPPHGGLGIGLERFAMKLLKLDNIRSATLFPRDVDRLDP